MNIQSALRSLFPGVNSGRGPLPGIDYVIGVTTPAKGQPAVTSIAAWTPRWPLAAGAVYPAQPTADQLTVALAPTAAQTYAAAVAAGYTVPGVTPPLVLDLSDEAQGKFTSLLVLLNALMGSGQLLATSIQTIADKNGAPRAMAVSQIESILVGYGVFYANLFNTLHAATTGMTGIGG